MAEEFPKLFSDEEFDAVQEQRDKGAVTSSLDAKRVELTRLGQRTSDGLPESALEQKFPHIVRKLITLWPSEACALYLDSMMIDDRGGRQGFPFDVLEDLIMLRDLNSILNARRAAPPISAPNPPQRSQSASRT